MSAAGRVPRRQELRIYISIVIAIGLVVVCASTVDLFKRPHGNWYILAGLTLVSGWLSVKLPSISASISISETFVFAGTLLFGRSVGTILVLLDVIVLCIKSQLSRRKLRWEQVLFNLATPPLSIWLGATVAGIVDPFAPGPLDLHFILALAAFTCVFFLLNSWIVTFAVSLEQDISAISLWWANFKELSVNFAAGASIAAFLFNFSGNRVHLSFILVIVPLLLIIYLTYSRFTTRIERERQKNTELNRVFLSTIEALALAIDAKDQVTHGHIRRVQRFTLALADALGVRDEKQLDAIKAAALLHDTGKLAVPEYILNKPGPLTSSEFERMKLHAPVGADILRSIEFPYPVEPIVRHHHVNWDGSGYPDRLRGQEIPLGARMLSVVDCYDALTSDRPYRPRMPRQQAEQVLRDRRGSMYDPWVVDEFIRILDRLEGDERERLASEMSADSMLASQQLEVITSTSAEEREFSELSRELPKASSLSAAANVLFRHLKRVIPAATFALYVPAVEQDELTLLVSAGAGAAALKDVRVRIGDPISGWAFSHQETVENSDPALEFGPVARSFPIPLRFGLAVPVSSGQPFGVIAAYGGEAFSADHRRLLENAASLFGSSFLTARQLSLEDHGVSVSGQTENKRLNIH